ncbi:MAG: hypothetical protein CBC48_03605, partial [bacterium TMED88]
QGRVEIEVNMGINQARHHHRSRGEINFVPGLTAWIRPNTDDFPGGDVQIKGFRACSGTFTVPDAAPADFPMHDPERLAVRAQIALDGLSCVSR